MNTSAKNLLAATVMCVMTLTATISFSAYTPEAGLRDGVKSDILFPVSHTAAPAMVHSTALLKQDRAAFGLTNSDRDSIKSVITRQITAFAKGDAKTAYELAAPLAQNDFDNPKQFLSGLSDVYGLLTVARIERMDGLDLSDGTPRQRMVLTSPSGQQWVAEFTMQKHASGNWKVLGFMIEDAPGTMI